MNNGLTEHGLPEYRIVPSDTGPGFAVVSGLGAIYSIGQIEGKPMWTTSTLKVRQDPSTDGIQIGSLKCGEQVLLSEPLGGADPAWTRINYNDRIGYCATRYLVDTRPTATPVKTSGGITKSTTALPGVSVKTPADLAETQQDDYTTPLLIGAGVIVALGVVILIANRKGGE